MRYHKYDYQRWATSGLQELFDKRFEIIDNETTRDITYELKSCVEALLAYKRKNKSMLAIIKSLWHLISRTLFWTREETNEEYKAISQKFMC